MSNTYKIIHIIPNLCKGGAERLVISICKELLKREGIEATLITFSDVNEYSYFVEGVKWKVIPASFIPSISGKFNLDIQELQSFVNDFNPDVIHSHLWEAEIVSRQIVYPKAKWFSHFHDNMHQLSTAFPTSKLRLTEWYERLLMLKKYKQCNNSFICIGKDTYHYALKVLPKYLKKHTCILKNAIDFNKFFNADISLQNELKLINIGSLVNKKNQTFLLEVVALLRKKGVSIHLCLLGDGIDRLKLEHLVVDKKLKKHVSLFGNVDMVEKYLWASAIYVHSATYEPFGLVLLEAMAAGLPVVTLDGKGNRELIEQGKNGFMVYEQDAELFAEKILEIWNNKNLYQQMSQYAQSFAKKYDIKEYVDSLLKIYQS